MLGGWLVPRRGRCVELGGEEVSVSRIRGSLFLLFHSGVPSLVLCICSSEYHGVGVARCQRYKCRKCALSTLAVKRLLPRPDGDRGQAGAVRLIRGGHVHEGDDAPVHVLLRIEQGLRGQPEGAGCSLADRVRDRLDARRLGALEIGRNYSGGQLQHVLAGRGLIQRTQR